MFQNVVPEWISKSTVQTDDRSNLTPVDTIDEDDDLASGNKNPVISNPSIQSLDNDDEIQSLLLRHEKKTSSSGGILQQKLLIPGADSDDQSDKSESDSDFDETNKKKILGNLNLMGSNENDEEMSSGDDDGDIPVVKVGGEEYAITDIQGNESIIEKMTSEEKDRYIQISQDFYSNVYE